jgi:long-chain-fatty-acid--CoA ligase ACSBG
MHARVLVEKEQKVQEMEWQVWTWDDYFRDIRAFGKSLISLGVELYKITNILGFNSPEWFIANCGSIYAGCIAAGIYATNSPEACKYISEHSRAQVIVVDGSKQLIKYTKISAELPSLKAIVVYGQPVDEAIASRCSVRVYSWENFLQLGAEVPDSTCTSLAA